MKWLARHRKTQIALLVLAGLFVVFLCIPAPKFDKPYSTVLTAKNGELLGAKIADDGQWRFPATNDYSPKYIACLMEYEDRWFFFHPGFNPVAFVKSFVETVKAGEVCRTCKVYFINAHFLQRTGGGRREEGRGRKVFN